jgi:hypothetical protein
MKAYRIVDRCGELRLTMMFSTRDRAERELRDDELGEEDGYFIRECELSDEEYAQLLANEANEDDETDKLLSNGAV